MSRSEKQERDELPGTRRVARRESTNLVLSFFNRPLTHSAVVVCVASAVLFGQWGGETPLALHLGLSILSVLAVLVESRGRIRRHPFLSSYGLLTVLGGLSAAWAYDIYLVYSVWSRMLIALCGAFVYWSYFKSRKDVERFGQVHLLCATVFLAYIASGHDYSKHTFQMGGANTLGPMALGLCVVGVFLWLSGVRRYIWLAPFHLYMLILSSSQKSLWGAVIFLGVLFAGLLLRHRRATTVWKTMAIVAILAGSGWLAWREPILESVTVRTRARSSNTLAALGVVGSEYATAEEPTGGRSKLVAAGLRYWVEKPILGHGLNNFRPLHGAETGIATYSHNTLIELLVGVGPLGVVLFLWPCIALLVALGRGADERGTGLALRAGIGTFLLIGLAQEVFYMTAFFVLVSLAIGSCRYEQLRTGKRLSSGDRGGLRTKDFKARGHRAYGANQKRLPVRERADIGETGSASGRRKSEGI